MQVKRKKKDGGFVLSVVVLMFPIIRTTSLGDVRDVRRVSLRQVMDQEETSEEKLGGLERPQLTWSVKIPHS